MKKRTSLLLLLAAVLALTACGGPGEAPSGPAAPGDSSAAGSGPSAPSSADRSTDPAPEPDGVCGEDVTWRLDGCTLILSGTGPTYDYSNLSDGESAPWREDNEDEAANVREVIIEPGVTRIGACLFRKHTNLLKVTIPDTVTEIGNSAFTGCAALKSVELPDSLLTIDHYAFSSCRLGSVTIPEQVEMIGNYAFHYNPLSSVTIAGRAPSIYADAFYGEGQGVVLTDVYYAGSEEEWAALEKGSLNWDGLTIHCNSTGA